MRGGIGRTLIVLQVLAAPAGAQIAGHPVISELYGGGGNIGAVYRNDFVEIYNPSAVECGLAGWSIQYASATGTGTWHASQLGGRIGPFAFYLVQLAGGTNGIPLPAPDTTGSINMSATAGKIALVRSTLPLSGVNPRDSTIVDLVGYGAANGFEGTGPAPAAGAAASIERRGRPGATAAEMAPGGAEENSGNGWDSNDNTADFVAQTVLHPQNRSSSPERPPDDLLPIRFGSLSAAAQGSAGVLVSWSTLSETACYGFIVERSAEADAGFASVSDLIPGHGTTIITQRYEFADREGTPGKFYRVREIDTNGAEWLSETVRAEPLSSTPRGDTDERSSVRSFPNPFNPGTTITYHLSSPGHVHLAIYDAIGREIQILAHGRQAEGTYVVTWDARSVPGGIYFCRLQAGGGSRILRLVHLR